MTYEEYIKIHDRNIETMKKELDSSINRIFNNEVESNEEAFKQIDASLDALLAD